MTRPEDVDLTHIVVLDWPDDDDVSGLAPGTTKQTCGECGKAVAVSPSGVRTEREVDNAVFACMACTEAEAKRQHAAGEEIEMASYEENPLAQDAVALGASEGMVRRLSSMPGLDAIKEVRQRVDDAKRRDTPWTKE